MANFNLITHTDQHRAQIDIVIRRFFAGDLGYRVKWEMSTDYILHNSEGDMIYMHTINLEPRITGKFGSPSADYEPIVVNLIRETFESFMNDPEVQKILRNN